MTLPASIAIQTKLNLSQNPHKFNLTLLTDFEAESIGFGDVRGNFKIINPLGITTYDNTSLVNPDVYYIAVSGITRIGSVATVVTVSAHGLVTGDTVRIGYAGQSEYNGLFDVTVLSATSFSYTVSGAPATPATGGVQCLRVSLNSVQIANDIATGMPYEGNYEVVVTVDIAAGGQEGIYTKEYNYGFSYTRPLVSISQSINVFLPRIYYSDNTIYTVNGIVPVLVRNKTVDYPAASGFSPTTTGNQTDEINPPKVWNGIYTTSVVSYVTYTQDDDLIIYDRVFGSKSDTFVADVDLCSINCCLNNLNNQYSLLVGKNTTLANEIQVKLNRALQLKQLYLGNIQCGNSEQAAKNLEDFYCVTGCDDDCGCGEPTGPIVPYNGYVGSTILEYNSEIPFYADQYLNYNGSIYKVLVTTSAGENPTNTPDKFELLFLDVYGPVTSVQSVTSQATVTPTYLNYEVTITALAQALTIANPTGTWKEGQPLLIRIKDDGTPRGLTFDTKFREIGTSIPTITSAAKTLYVGCVYNLTDDTFDVIGVNQEL